MTSTDLPIIDGACRLAYARARMLIEDEPKIRRPSKKRPRGGPRAARRRVGRRAVDDLRAPARHPVRLGDAVRAVGATARRCCCSRASPRTPRTCSPTRAPACSSAIASRGRGSPGGRARLPARPRRAAARRRRRRRPRPLPRALAARRGLLRARRLLALAVRDRGGPPHRRLRRDPLARRSSRTQRDRVSRNHARAQPKTIVRLPDTSTRRSRCSRTARVSTRRSSSPPLRTSSSTSSRWLTRQTSCSMIGP